MSSITKQFKDLQVPMAPFLKHFKIFESIRLPFQNSKSLNSYSCPLFKNISKFLLICTSPVSKFKNSESVYIPLQNSSNIFKSLRLPFENIRKSLSPYDSYFKILQNLRVHTSPISKF